MLLKGNFHKIYKLYKPQTTRLLLEVASGVQSASGLPKQHGRYCHARGIRVFVEKNVSHSEKSKSDENATEKFEKLMNSQQPQEDHKFWHVFVKIQAAALGLVEPLQWLVPG